MANRAINYELGDHLTIIGATGSGKTRFVNEFLRQFAVQTHGYIPIYIFDTKQQGDFNHLARKGVGQLQRGQKPLQTVQAKGAPFVVHQLEFDDFNIYDESLKNIYIARKPSITYIDEISSLTKGAGTPPRHYEILAKQGRGLKESVITGSQSPSYVPPSTLRQVTHMIRMHLNDEYDIKKLMKSMGRVIEEEPYDDYGFWYRDCSKHIRKSPPIYYKHMQEFFGIEN